MMEHYTNLGYLPGKVKSSLHYLSGIMSTSSKYFDSIRISASKKTRAEPEVAPCQWAGCDKPGTHKAPAGRNREGQYFHFCIDHVREYNKNFNYFSGLSDSEIAKFQKDAITGHRPTWKAASAGTPPRTSSSFSQLRSGSAASQRRLHGVFNMFQEHARAAPVRRLKTLERKAFVTLELEAGASADKIKAQYKLLVKRHHPDSNGGDRSSEERLREVLQAYNLLKKAGFC